MLQVHSLWDSVTLPFQRLEAHHSQSSCFNIIPPGGDVSLNPKQAGEGGGAVVGGGRRKEPSFMAGFFSPERAKEWFSQCCGGKKDIFFWTTWVVYIGNRQGPCLEVSPLCRDWEPQCKFCLLWLHTESWETLELVDPREAQRAVDIHPSQWACRSPAKLHPERGVGH